ncbi:hypothetical protein ABPG75_011511 [Micractinium tetrahymenae]
MLQRERHLTSALLGRQLQGGPVHRRPFVAEFCCEDGTVMNNPTQIGTPAFAAQYSRHYNDCKLLAIADEEGYVSIVDTACQLPTEMADDWGPNKPRAQWAAHRNAVFDLAWCNDDTRMLTASGDQTVSLWDTGHADLLASFRGHSGSVKTVCPMPAAHEVFASGARDGALMVWDARAAQRQDATTGEVFHAPVLTVQDAHAPSGKQKRRRTPLQGRTRPSVTSLAFLQGQGNQLATGGVDGVVKFWDLRQTGAPVGEAAPWLELDRLCDAGVPPISQKQHGITSLALHPQGNQLLVSLTGGHHFLYDPLRPHIGPSRWFGGHTVASFYVKAGWSPDGTHIISGSTDRNVYIWEVDAPDGASPYVLAGHQGEVTAVAWCPSDFHQIATTADDATLKVWHIWRRQPEEQADDGAARQPWVYPWQQQQQVAAAAAAAAAYGSVGQLPADETPLAAGLASASTAAATPGSATPWATGARAGTGGSSSSAAMLAALRGPPGGAVAQAAASLAQPDAENRPPLHNMHNAQQQQAQQQQAQGAAGGAADTQQQQQQPAQRQLDAAPASADVPRSAPWHTPFAAHAGGATSAGRSPATAAGGVATAGTGGRPAARRIADLLNAVPSTRRNIKQQSIASFLRSPAVGSAGGAGASTVRKGGSSAAAAASSRDLPDAGGNTRRAAAAAGAPGANPTGASGASSSKRGREQPSPLPAGLGGSSLPSPRFAKRLRTSFEVGTSRPGAAGAAGAASATAAAALTSPRAGCGSATAAAAAARQAAGAAAQLLEPSPEVAAVAPAGKLAGAAGALGRQGSNDENLLSNFKVEGAAA